MGRMSVTGERIMATEVGKLAIKRGDAVQKSERRLRQVVEAAPNAMVMINATGVIEMVNAQTERLFGYPRDEMLGRNIEMLVPERFRRHHPGLRASYFGKPVAAMTETRFRITVASTRALN